MDFLSGGVEGFCEALNNTEVSVLFCERFDGKSNIWNFNRHKHDCIELLYFLDGTAEVSLADTSIGASLYDLVIYPSGTYHTEHLQFNHRQEVICVWIDIPGLTVPNVIRIQDKDASLKWLLLNLHDEYKSENKCRCLIDNYLKTIAILIARKCFLGNSADNYVSRIMLYIQDHMSEQLTVEQLSELIYVSKSYLSRLFKQQTGLSLIEYLRLVRIEKAKTLLISSNVSIEEISNIIGYNSPKYFCRAFRICSGMSPSEFKNMGKKLEWRIPPGNRAVL